MYQGKFGIVARWFYNPNIIHMRKIIVKAPRNEELVSQLESIVNAFSNIEAGEELDFDLTNIGWCCPLLVLPISAYVNDTSSSFSLPSKEDTKSYLQTISFPMGIDSVSELEASMQCDAHNFTAVVHRTSTHG